MRRMWFVWSGLGFVVLPFVVHILYFLFAFNAPASHQMQATTKDMPLPLLFDYSSYVAIPSEFLGLVLIVL